MGSHLGGLFFLFLLFYETITHFFSSNYITTTTITVVKPGFCDGIVDFLVRVNLGVTRPKKVGLPKHVPSAISNMYACYSLLDWKLQRNDRNL